MLDVPRWDFGMLQKEMEQTGRNFRDVVSARAESTSGGVRPQTCSSCNPPRHDIVAVLTAAPVMEADGGMSGAGLVVDKEGRIQLMGGVYNGGSKFLYDAEEQLLEIQQHLKRRGLRYD